MFGIIHCSDLVCCSVFQVKVKTQHFGAGSVLILGRKSGKGCSEFLGRGPDVENSFYIGLN
jgi:hypothetical protein